jgi:hypothetical protein
MTQTRPAGWRSQEDYDGFMMDFHTGNGVCMMGLDGLYRRVPHSEMYLPAPCPICGQESECKPGCGWFVHDA